MLVYAQGTSIFSQPSRYHLTKDCWINVTGWAKQVPVHKVFTIDRDEAERRGWYLCPYCAPLPSAGPVAAEAVGEGPGGEVAGLPGVERVAVTHGAEGAAEASG